MAKNKTQDNLTMESSVETPTKETKTEQIQTKPKLNFINPNDERLVNASVLGYQELVKVKDIVLPDKLKNEKDFIYVLQQERLSIQKVTNKNEKITPKENTLTVEMLPKNVFFNKLITLLVTKKPYSKYYTFPIVKELDNDTTVIEDEQLMLCLKYFDKDLFAKRFPHILSSEQRRSMVEEEQDDYLYNKYELSYKHLLIDTKSIEIEKAKGILHIPFEDESVDKSNIDMYASDELRKVLKLS